MLKIVGLLVVIAIAAYFTKPNAAAMNAAANAKLEEVTSAAVENVDVGGTIAGAAAQGSGGHYEDLYVLAKYSAPSTNEPLVECWGAFTQTMCNKVGSPQ